MWTVDGEGGEFKTVTMAVVLYALLDLVRWLVKKIVAKGQREEEMYQKERAIMHDIRNTLQAFELKLTAMNTRIIDKLSDIVSDIKDVRNRNDHS